MIVVGPQGHAQAQMTDQTGGDPRVLAQQQIQTSQSIGGPPGQIGKIADWRGDQKQFA